MPRHSAAQPRSLAEDDRNWRATRRAARHPRRDAVRLFLFLPYGIWQTADGRAVLFNRRYEPILARDADGRLLIPAPAERVAWVRQAWFYDDSNPPWRSRASARRISAVVTEWLDAAGVSDDGLTGGEIGLTAAAAAALAEGVR
jgi:hypothetical protein